VAVAATTQAIRAIQAISTYKAKELHRGSIPWRGFLCTDWADLANLLQLTRLPSQRFRQFFSHVLWPGVCQIGDLMAATCLAR